MSRFELYRQYKEMCYRLERVPEFNVNSSGATRAFIQGKIIEIRPLVDTLPPPDFFTILGKLVKQAVARRDNYVLRRPDIAFLGALGHSLFEGAELMGVYHIDPELQSFIIETYTGIIKKFNWIVVADGSFTICEVHDV